MWLVNHTVTSLVHLGSQEPICFDDWTYRHTEIGAASQTCCLTQSQYADNTDPWRLAGQLLATHSSKSVALFNWESNPGSTVLDADTITSRSHGSFQLGQLE